MSKKKIRFAVIGCGLMGREFASAAARWCHLTKDIPAPVIVGVSDISENARAWFTDNFDSVKYSTSDYRELLSNVDGATYLERVAVNNVANVKKAKAAIKKAFQNQIEGKGFSLVEVLSTCPTNWGLAPDKAITWLEENMLPYYPLGVYKDKYAEEK